jgi:hypothetical protein
VHVGEGLLAALGFPYTAAADIRMMPFFTNPSEGPP